LVREKRKIIQGGAAGRTGRMLRGRRKSKTGGVQSWRPWSGCKMQMTRRWGKLSRRVLCAAGRGERTGLREGRSVPWPSKKKNEIPRGRGAAPPFEKKWV
jgi:hypothetical protein